MSNRKGMTGNEAVAEMVKLVNPDVVAAYPITPQTIVVERISDYVHDGIIDTEFVCVESEHSAMSACMGASATGARVFTASASQGIALMYEILFIVASARLPVVMSVANRALSGPINIHGEQTDQYVCRDTSWISMFCEDAQETYDSTLIAFKIGEHPDISLPVMYGYDGFIISHALEAVEQVSKQQVTNFLPAKREIKYPFAPGSPITSGTLTLQDFYMEYKAQQETAMLKVPAVMKKVFQEFGEMTGRHYSAIESYKLEDAEYAFISSGSIAGTSKHMVDILRAKGEKVGLLKIRALRPLPMKEIREALKDLKSVCVIDRSVTFGSGMTMMQKEVASALYGVPNPPALHGRTVALGGRDLMPRQFIEIYEDFKDTTPGEYKWVGVKE